MLDEVPVEVRFPVTPPDRIALAERDLASRFSLTHVSALRSSEKWRLDR